MCKHIIPNNHRKANCVFPCRYVYERITPRNRKPAFQHLLFTQLVSGLWHGLHPGYLMFFASSSFWIYSATALYKMEQGWPWRKSPVWYCLKVLWTQMILNYISLPFVVSGCVRVCVCEGTTLLGSRSVFLAQVGSC